MKTFEEMLDNVYVQLNEIKHPTTKLIIPIPIIEQSTTNTYWKNIKKILITINRPGDHFVDYLNSELKTGNWISSSKSDGLVLLGRFNNKVLTQVLHNYVKKYVICNICKSANTTLDKNKDLRTYVISCNQCNSKYGF